MRFLPALLFACVSALPAGAQTTYVAPAAPGSANVAVTGSLEVARNENEVLLTWTLPEGDFRQIEIYRNSHQNTTGRGRVTAVRATTTLYHDVVPDLTVTYWYWVKLTRGDGSVVNIGPVPTPDPSVWTP